MIWGLVYSFYMLLTTFYTHSRVLEIPKSYLWTRLPYSNFLLLLLFIYIHRRKWEDEPFGTGGNFPIVKRIALISLCFICILFWSSFAFVVLFQQLNTRHSLQQWTNSLHSIASKFGDELVNQVRFCWI